MHFPLYAVYGAHKDESPESNPEEILKVKSISYSTILHDTFINLNTFFLFTLKSHRKRKHREEEKEETYLGQVLAL